MVVLEVVRWASILWSGTLTRSISKALVFSWDLVLDAVSRPPIEPIIQVAMKVLCFKRALLLPLASVKRLSSATLCTVSAYTWCPVYEKGILRWFPCLCTKESLAGVYSLGFWGILSFSLVFHRSINACIFSAQWERLLWISLWCLLCAVTKTKTLEVQLY